MVRKRFSELFALIKFSILLVVVVLTGYSLVFFSS